MAHPQLDGHGQHQHHHQGRGKGHRLRMDDFRYGGFDQFHTDDKNQRCHRQTGQVFHSGVAVGVVLVGGLFGQLEAQQRHHGAGGVGQVVDSVGGDGHAA